MARLVVQYPADAGVIVDGAAVGRTNRVLPLGTGHHVVRLDINATEPGERSLDVDAASPAEHLLRIGFSPAAPTVERLSPLYIRYNGFLLGQFLSLAFAAAGRPRYAERRARMLEFLREIDVAVTLPEAPPELGGPGHAALLTRILPLVAARSRELAEFVVLGGLLTHYGILAHHDAETAASVLVEIERLRAAYDLPPIDPARFAVPPDRRDPDLVLSPSLAYLREIVVRLPVEADTAFVIMPFTAPYAGYYASFYRPALEQCGYRAFRAWGGLASEDYADLLLALVGKSGFVWADISESNHNVMYEIGAAHALGKLSAIVVREDLAATVPGNIGHDAVVRYDPGDPDWPAGPVLLMAACIAALELAADRGERLRVTPDSIARVFDEVSQSLRRVLLPPEALEAQRRGRRAMDAGELDAAEASFDEACRLGLNDEETRLWRGWARLGLGRVDEAAVDLDAVLGGEPESRPAGEWRPVAAYMRGVLREAQGDLPNALRDFELALALGLGDPDARERRDAIAAQLAAKAGPDV